MVRDRSATSLSDVRGDGGYDYAPWTRNCAEAALEVSATEARLGK